MKKDYNELKFIITDMDGKTETFVLTEFDQKKQWYKSGGKVLTELYKQFTKKGFLLKYIRNIQILD